MRLPIPVMFVWDEGNINKNWDRHKVHFKEAEEVFFNIPLKIFKDKKHSQNENRFVALGVTDKNKNLYIVFTIRSKKIRIISVRNQSKKERRLYDEKEK